MPELRAAERDVAGSRENLAADGVALAEIVEPISRLSSSARSMRLSLAGAVR